MNTERKMFQKDYVFLDLKKQYPGRVFLLPTYVPIKIRGKTITRWADCITFLLFKTERRQLKDTSFYFSYIKFAKRQSGETVAIVAGKSQFHWKNTSDLYFYKIIEDDTKDAAEYMYRNNLTWDTDEFLVFLNEDPFSQKEADDNEANLQKYYNLF